MKKITAICVVAICVFPLVNASTLEKPEWKEGDYWQYAMGMVGTEGEKMASTTILGVENITIGNTTYHCIVARQKDNASENLVYYDEESLAFVKETIYSNETNKTEEKIYDPPLSLFQYPIFIGKKWNTTIEWMNTSTTIQLECNGKKEISTRAGKFDCYVIKANYGPNETVNPYFYQVLYTSGMVGNIAKAESYANGTLVAYTELLSFHYNACPKEQQNYAIILLLIAIVIFISLLVLYKFKRNR
ncbi:MAG: hypothetical protein U9O96_01020 [Candidatus Thermoplasmatota archaeon]|nr:hypothetical protein [Candidatus Thermoplasmatota archaeon]